MDVDEFAPRIAFFFACHSDLFEEVAKFRAARRLYAKIMRDRFGARNARSQMLRFHTQTGGVTLTAQQADNNIVRVALQSLAAVLGGTQSLHSNSKDEALALPTEESARTALRTQQIIAYESGAASTIDPLAGSFYVEKLTDELEAEAITYIDKIDRLGGMVAAIEQGYVQREIEQAAYEYGQSIERNERIIVGVNQFQADEEPDYEHFVVSEAAATKQIERLERVRRNRDSSAVHRTLAALEEAARGSANLMPPILAAVRAYASIGEICASLQRVFGDGSEYCETSLTL
jgi:methylmalonyl-CoA mutase N-terminal domain/subunit